MGSPYAYDLQGQGGGIVLAAGGITSNIRWVQCLTDCVFDSFQSANGNLEDANNIQGVTIPAGAGIGGDITFLTLASGLAIAYRR